MSKVYLHKSFLDDIASSKDASFVRRVFLILVAELRGKPNQSNDHRYQGINNAWIRYISGGKTAFRLIYIKDGASIIYYRCGAHSIEENLAAPDLDSQNLTDLELDDVEIEEMTLPKTFLTNHSQKLTLTALVGRRLIPNKEAWIVSPVLSEEFLRRGAILGRLLDSLVGDGTAVTVITALDQVKAYQKICVDLAARNIDVYFVPRLHSKIYLFITDDTVEHQTAGTPSLGVIGSSNLTSSGIAKVRGYGNMETNYSVPSESISELTDLVYNYFSDGLDYQKATKQFKNLKGISK